MHRTRPGTSCSSLLWARWEKISSRNKNRIVLIEAASGKTWTAAELNASVAALGETLGIYSPGVKIAFCLPNGPAWMALFLTLQQWGLVAVPLDASLPEKACLELAKALRCHALFVNGALHPLENGRKAGGFCCIKVTSGTSGGRPKSVPCRAEHLTVDGTNIIRTMGIRPGDRNLAAIPLGHSYGLGNFVLPLILQGTPVVCAGNFVPRQLAEWIATYQVTVFPSVPAIYRVLASMPGDCTLAPLRLPISAGAPLTAEVARVFHARYGLKIRNFYGSSETGGICYDRRGDATLSGRSVGKPLNGVEVTIKDNALTVHGAAVAKPGGLWKTPDRGEWNAQGEITLMGRTGREVNIGGKKVHPAEVEVALRSITGVSDALVLLTPQNGRTLVHAVVETRLKLADLQRALATKLPEWKFPKNYLLLPELPRSSRGKIDIAALRKLVE